MFRLLIFFVMLLSASELFGQVASQREIDRVVAKRLLNGQEALFERDYEKATAIFRGLMDDYPKSPAGYFGWMALDEVQMLEHEDFHLEADFERTAAVGKKVIDGVMQRYRPSSTELMFSGSLLGLHGFLKARGRHWWDAYFLGAKSRQIFRRIKEMDPSFIDADFGLGMYIYWRSIFTKELTFLPFFPDRRAEGVAIVKRVAEKGWLARDLARVNLGVMYIEEKRYREAIAIFSDYVGRYPANIILRSMYGRVLLANRQYPEAIEQFRKILETEKRYRRAHYFIAVASILQGGKERFAVAREELATFETGKPNEEWQSYIHYWRGRLAEAEHDVTRAKQEYHEAVRKNPKLQGATFRLRALGGGL